MEGEGDYKEEGISKLKKKKKKKKRKNSVSSYFYNVRHTAYKKMISHVWRVELYNTMSVFLLNPIVIMTFIIIIININIITCE